MTAASIRTFALASLASLAMATSSSAVTILQYGQTNPNDSVLATVSGSSTTLTTNSSLAPGSIPIQITNIGGIPTVQPAFLTFIGVTSTGTATNVAGEIQQLFNGTIAITAGPNNTGGNFLTTVFQNASLNGLTGGGSAALVGSQPPQAVTFSSNFGGILPLLSPANAENFSISFSDITPPLSLAGTTIATFTAETSGTFATLPPTAVIPEPSGVVMAGTAMLGCLGCMGWRRRSSRA